MQDFAIEITDLSQITPYEQNPRHNEAAVAAVAESIRQFGVQQAILVDRDKVIIAGHTRYKAAKLLGMTRFPVRVANDLTPEQVRAYRIADNKTGELAEWDESLLASELESLRCQFDFASLGFSESELDRLLHDELLLGDPEAVPEVPKIPTTQSGDLYVLGDHRLLCGDSTKSEDVEKLMNGEQAELLLTDPPYNIGYVGHTSERLTIANDNQEESAFQDFLTRAFRAGQSVMVPGSAFYVWYADLHAPSFRMACATAGFSVRQQLIWNKNSFILGRQDYQWKHEPCLYGWTKGTHCWFGDRKQTTVIPEDFESLDRDRLIELVKTLTCEIPSTVIECEKPNRNDDHPTMKPVKLFAGLLSNSTQHGERVLDLFGGSGTTMIAAEQTGRKCFMMELDPKYCDVIVRRWEDFTGRKAAVHGVSETI